MGNLRPSLPFYVNGKCWHRKVIMRRWQDDVGWHAYERCRWCQDWWEVTIMVDKQGKTVKNRKLIPDQRLENDSSKSDKPIVPRGTIRDIDTESGSFGPKDAS
jgi:hypothetical protein